MDGLQQQIVFAGASMLCAGIGAVHDIRDRRIPNCVTLPAMVAGLMVHWFVGGRQGMADSALAGLIAGALFLIFSVAGGMGAGDVKLMAAVGCISGLEQLRLVTIATAIAGGVFALAVSLYHGRLRETLRNVGALLLHHGRCGLEPHPELNLSNAQTLRLPFALPITVGCLIAICTLAREAYL